MARFTEHARDRARERYGLELSDADLQGIWRTCVNRTALLAKADDKTHIFIVQFKGTSVVPVLPANDERIITFLPSDFFARGQRMQYYKGLGVAKQKCRHAKFAGGPTYRRERISVRDVMDEMEP
jgi:hypothetical protein